MDKPALHGQSWDAGAASLAVASDDLLIGIAADFILTATVLLLNVLYQLGCRAFTRLKSMYITNSRPFPFEALPRELRDMVYTELLEDVYYPAPAAHQPASPLNGLLTNLWSHAPNPRTTPRKPSTWILLANKQIHAEFTSLLCKHSTFHLTVSPTNYQPLTSASDNDNDNNNKPRIWNISPSTFTRIRTASLHLVATSAMLGCTDPRNMASSSWKLAERIRTQLSQMRVCTSLELTVTAVGDPLWNPLWIWFHAAQALKYMGTAMAGRTAESSTVDLPTQTLQGDVTTSSPLLQLRDSHTGPVLHRITFRLDTWSPGENFLRREHGAKGGDWVWCCGEGHVVARDGGPEQSVREFCAMLYRECGTCRPVEEEEEEEVVVVVGVEVEEEEE